MTTHEHLQQIISTIDCTINVKSVEALSGGKYKLFTSNTKWSTFGKSLSGYIISEVSLNEYVVVKSATSLSKGIYTLAAPFFFYNTFYDANQELLKKKSTNDKLPFIYLHLNVPEAYASEMDLIDFTSDCAIYFMVDANPKNWLTPDHYANAIKPMKSLVRQFIISLSNYAKTNASYNLTYTQNDYVNFGQKNEYGIDAKIFTDNMSGVELLIQIPFNKCLVCCN